MNKIYSLFILTLLANFSFSQKPYIINLSYEQIELPDRKFYIDSIIDNRINKSNIGKVKTGLNDKQNVADLQDGLKKSLLLYYFYSMERYKTQIPITIKINAFEISEKTMVGIEYGYADISFDYLYKSTLLFSDNEHLETYAKDVTSSHEKNIRDALKKSLQEFNESNWYEVYLGNEDYETHEQIQTDTIKDTSVEKNKIIAYKESGEPIQQSEMGVKVNGTSKEGTDETYVKQNRNVIAAGYQIGGYTLVGIDYEIRANDYFGIHFGAGWSGYTIGVKIHTGPSKNSNFFNLSYKDAGFGLLEAIGFEFGGRRVFYKYKNAGILYQIGLANIRSIDPQFEDLLFKGKGATKVMLSLGIGLSW